MSDLVFDLETSTGDKKTHGPSAKDSANDFYTIIYGDTPESVVIEHKEEGFKRKLPKGFTKLLSSTTLIVGHNLNFDLSYIWKTLELREFLLKGGEIWDTQLAHYLMSGQRHTFPSLGELQNIYLGTKVKEDRISRLYKRGVGADKMVGARDRCPRFFKLYEKYSYDDGITTLKIKQKQVLRAEELGMTKIIKMYNKYLLSLILASNTGIKIDLDKCQKTRREFKLRELDLLEQAQALIKDYWSDERLPTFNVNSPTHKSAMLFGGDIKVTTRKNIGWCKTKIEIQDQNTQKIMSYPQYEKQFINEAINLGDARISIIRTPYEEGCGECDECLGYYDRETGEYINECTNTTTEIAEDESLIWVEGTPHPEDILTLDWSLEYRFKVLSGTPKLRNFNEYVNITGFNLPLSFTKESKVEGRYKTGSDIIEKIYKNSSNEAAKEYCRLQKEAMTIHKMSSTYLEAFNSLSIDERLYPNFNNTATATSRLSSSNPNLQNVPSKSEMAKSIQGLFVAPTGWKCVQIDYSQLEIYVTAWLSGDVAMTRDLLNGVDFHCLRMSWCKALSEGKTYEEIIELSKIKKLKKWVVKRVAAKQISFQKAYGAGAYSLAESTGLEVDDVKELMQKEDNIYYRVKAFNEHVMQTVQNNTEYSTKKGLPSYLLRGGVNGKRFDNYGYELLPIKSGDNIQYEEGLRRKIGYFQTITSKRYAYEEFGNIDRRGCLRQNFSPTQTKNYQTQGTANDIIGAALAKMFIPFLKHPNKVQLLNSIHDCVWLYVKEEYLDLIIPQVCTIMSNIPKLFKEYLDIDVPFEFPVEAEVGDNFAELEEFIIKERVNET